MPGSRAIALCGTRFVFLVVLVLHGYLPKTPATLQP